jgi:hypothetical protein
MRSSRRLTRRRVVPRTLEAVGKASPAQPNVTGSAAAASTAARSNTRPSANGVAVGRRVQVEAGVNTGIYLLWEEVQGRVHLLSNTVRPEMVGAVTDRAAARRVYWSSAGSTSKHLAAVTFEATADGSPVSVRLTGDVAGVPIPARRRSHPFTNTAWRSPFAMGCWDNSGTRGIATPPSRRVGMSSSWPRSGLPSPSGHIIAGRRRRLRSSYPPRASAPGVLSA